MGNINRREYAIRGAVTSFLTAASGDGRYFFGDRGVASIDFTGAGDPLRLIPLTYEQSLAACNTVVQGFSTPDVALVKYPDAPAVAANQVVNAAGPAFGFELRYTGPWNTFSRGQIAVAVSDGASAAVYTAVARFNGPGLVRGFFISNAGGQAQIAKLTAPRVTILAATSQVAIGDSIAVTFFNQRHLSNVPNKPV